MAPLQFFPLSQAFVSSVAVPAHGVAVAFAVVVFLPKGYIYTTTVTTRAV